MPGSCVHLPGWLMSLHFPEVESPAGFAALEGSAWFQDPAHQGFSGFRCLSGLRDQHIEGAVPRTGPLLCLAVGVIFQLPSGGASGKKRGHRPKERLTFLQVSPRLPPAVSPQRGSLPSRSQRLRRACLRGPNTPAESRDRISSSANCRKQNPFEHPAGSSEECGLKTTRLEVDSPAALASSKAEGVVRVVSIVSRRSCLRFLSCWGRVLSFAQGLRVSRWKNNP